MIAEIATIIGAILGSGGAVMVRLNGTREHISEIKETLENISKDVRGIDNRVTRLETKLEED